MCVIEARGLGLWNLRQQMERDLIRRKEENRRERATSGKTAAHFARRTCPWLREPRHRRDILDLNDTPCHEIRRWGGRGAGIGIWRFFNENENEKSIRLRCRKWESWEESFVQAIFFICLESIFKNASFYIVPDTVTVCFYIRCVHVKIWRDNYVHILIIIY